MRKRIASRVAVSAKTRLTSGHPSQDEWWAIPAIRHIPFRPFCQGKTNMPTNDRIDGYVDDLIAIRKDLHAHPEIGFEEVRTSGIVAEKLKQWGIEVHRGIGGTRGG